MPGVRGAGGPVPKRSSQRRRKNKPQIPATKALGAPKPETKGPPADPKWHPVAKQWFESLRASGQATFYEPSDWGVAVVIAESISRELKPQALVVGQGEGAELHMVEMPPKGASLAAWLKAMTALMATEGDRRRLRLELERPGAGGEPEVSGVADIAEYRRRLANPAG